MVVKEWKEVKESGKMTTVSEEVFLVSLNCLIITEQLDIKTKQKNIDNIQNKITLQVTPKNL